MAYFAKLRESWSPEESAPWKESWKRKKEMWNKKRHTKPKGTSIENGLEEKKKKLNLHVRRREQESHNQK